MKAKIIHYAKRVNGEVRYTCNQSCNISKDKITFRTAKVTCKNCLRIMFGD